jgi:hypothetical protein
MQLRSLYLAGALLAAVCTPGALRAQAIAATPFVGVYTHANSFDELRSNAGDILRFKRDGSLALGVNLELGPFRGSLAYASDATIEARDTPGVHGDIGDGQLLAATADIVVRPIPRMGGIQPYALLGGGVKRYDYSLNQNPASAFPSEDTDPALHLGLGADVMFGGLGLMVEFSDFISRGQAGNPTQHDGFGSLGLRLRLF